MSKISVTHFHTKKELFFASLVYLRMVIILSIIQSSLKSVHLSVCLKFKISVTAELNGLYPVVLSYFLGG